MKRAIGVVLQVTLLVGLTTTVIGSVPAHAATLDPNCTNGGTLAANDDGSTAAITLPFGINFYSQPYSQVYINNNGNVTFNGPYGTYVPAPIGTVGIPIIAPLWADVDTRPSASADATWGTTTFDGQQAFCVSWDGVGFYNQHTSALDNFQMLLVDRSQGNAAGDFDIVFNYSHIGWDTSDTGGARAGYTSGTVANSFELPGSGTAGAFLDTSPTTGLANQSINSDVPGQDIFPVRNGNPVGTAPTITSADNATFTEGTAGSFTIMTTGNPTPAISLGDSGLPSGMNFTDNGNGTATLDGTPVGGSAGTYPLTIDASNGVSPDATQDFTLTVDPAQSPSLTLTKSGSPDPVPELNPITYTLDAGNNGTADASNVMVTDNLPAGTTFDSASSTQGSCSFAAPTVTCDLSTLGAGNSATVTITAQAPQVTSDTTITNTASVSASNADSVNASADTQVLVNQGGSTQGDVPPGTTVPLTFTTATQSLNGAPAVNATDPTAVSLIVPPGGPGGMLTLNEIPCTVAPCTTSNASTNAGPATAKLVLGGVVFNVLPPPNYSTNFMAVLLYDKTLHAKSGPVFYFKPGVTPKEITLLRCTVKLTNAGKPCVLSNRKIESGPSLILGDWKVVVQINSDPHLRR
jgi:uncharacterized repeat protein (TIGR01451 family)